MSEKAEQKEMQSVEDVEAYLQEVEARLASDFDAFKCEPDVVAHMVRQAHAVSSRLIAIVREYQRNHAFAMREWNHDALRANAAEAANKELQKRLAKYEGVCSRCNESSDDCSPLVTDGPGDSRVCLDCFVETACDFAAAHTEAKNESARERLAKLESERQPRIQRKLARLRQSRAKIAHRLDKMDSRYNRANDERALASIDAKIVALGGVAMDPLDERLAKLERDAAALDNNLP